MPVAGCQLPVGNGQQATHNLLASFAATALWLEVRESNARARALYLREGFAEAGRRRDYYPAPAGRREDAILMTRLLHPRPEA